MTKQYLLIKEEIDVARTIRKPTRHKCGVGIHALIVIGIQKGIEITIGIPLQRKIKSYPQKKESLNDQSASHPPIVYVGWGVA